MIVPVRATVQVEAWGTILLSEIVGIVGVGGVITPTAAEATTITNHRLDLPNDSGVTAVSTGTGATFMTSNLLEFWRDGHQGDVTVSAMATGNQASNLTKFKWSALEDGNWPIMYSSSAITRLNIFMSGQATTGFITLTFVKVPITV
jgi:hypothetical protein